MHSSENMRGWQLVYEADFVCVPVTLLQCNAVAEILT
jgi:hypothetical protein